jgi:hypothetical protein
MRMLLIWWAFGGPDRDRTDDLFHAMEARSQLRHRPTLRDATVLLSLLNGDSSNGGVPELASQSTPYHL